MRFVLVLLVCCSGASAAGSTFPADALETVPSTSGSLKIEVRTSPSQPPDHGLCEVELRVTDAQTGAPVDGAGIDVLPWMASHGHGASVIPTVNAAGAGRYVVTNVELFMPGAWELKTTVSGSVNDTATLPIDAR